MQFEHLEIDTASIDLSDQRYLFTDQQDIETLAESIRNVGLINPPVLQPQRNNDYRVVTGFRRVSACMCLNYRRIRVRTIEEGADYHCCIRIAAAENASARSFSLAEQCRLVEKLYELAGSKEAVSSALEPMGVCIPKDLVEKLIMVSRMPDAVKEGVYRNFISLNTVRDMQYLSWDSAEAAAGLFIKLRPTVNQQKEILSGLNDLAGRQGETVYSVIRKKEFSDILESCDIDRGRCLHLIRSKIYKLRYPALSRAEAEFFRRKKNLDLGEDIDLKPPQSFEGTTYTFIVRFSSAGQLCGQAETLGRICRHPDLEKILKREIEDPQDLY